MKNVIELTDKTCSGICDINRESCLAKTPNEVFSIFDNKREVFVCDNCFKEKIEEGSWIIKEE